MKTAPVFEMDRLSHADRMERQLEAELNLPPRMVVPAGLSDLVVDAEQLLTFAEEEVCNGATD